MQDYVVVSKLKRATLDRCLAKHQVRELPPAARRVLSVALAAAVGAAVSVLHGNGVALAAGLGDVHPIILANETVSVAPFQEYVHYVCRIIRWVTGGLIGLALTWLGSKQASSMESNASADIKRYIPQAIWGLFFVFFGSWIGDYFISHIPQ